ncbi:MAG: formyltransferase family protein [Candidatus Marinimicrobia bacterium]|nr:formyltransferase family protein [Candidatus Neomarinimicrobiota bacterium]
MRVTVFSSNQPRHLNLAREFAQFADTVYFVSEVNTIFPGKVSGFFQKTEVMQDYFSNVIQSEKKIFGDVDFLPNNVRTLAIKGGDLNLLSEKQLGNALSSDVFVVFGASYIKGWLIDFLVEKKAINIHMGLSPYYRGSSCNFWALYDGSPSYVGATVHMLSKGLDSGDMLFHCVPKFQDSDSLFDFTMRSVLVAQEGLVQTVKDNRIFSMSSVHQDKSLEVRYTKNNEFTDDVAKEFLGRDIDLSSEKFEYPDLLRPIFK